MSVRLLVVCTGNICRSPFAQLVLQEGLGSVRPGVFEVSSAGTAALVGEPVAEGSARILRGRGIDAAGFAARRVSRDVVSDVDLVLTMEAAHRGAVLSHVPSYLQRTYTLTEAARVLTAAGERESWSERLAGLTTAEERWAALPSHLARERGRTRVIEGADDIDDPYRQPQEAFDRMAAEVDAAVEQIVAFERQFD